MTTSGDVEERRLVELAQYGLLDRPADAELEAVVRLAAAVAGVPTATINLIDDLRQCQLAPVGFAGGDSAREDSMCAVHLLEGEPIRVPDAREHPDYADNPWVTGRLASVRFYASVPLLTPTRSVLGTLCVFDVEPATLSDGQLALLVDAAAVVVALFERRRQARALGDAAAQVEAQRELLSLTLQEMENRQELTDAVLETVDVGIVAADASGRLTVVNRAARAWHGLDADPAVEPDEHAARYRLLEADGRRTLTADEVPLARALRDGTVSEAEMVIAAEGRPAVRVLASGRALRDGRGLVLGAVVAMTDVTLERQRQADLHAAHDALVEDNADLARRARHDPLTGLPNRERLHEHLGQVLAAAAAASVDAAVGVLFIDLDGFKAVNDSLGHDAGDRLLVEVAHRLRRCLRGQDMVARLGGDEFVMVCADLTGPATAAAIAARVERAIAEPVALGSTLVEVQASIGMAVSAPGSTCDDLLLAADAAMYRAKATAKGRVAAHDGSARATPRRRPRGG